MDGNHAAIVAAARQMGFEVIDLSGVGRGCPDLLLYSHRTRRFTLVEVKTPSGKVNVLQADFASRVPVSVVRTVDDLLALRR